MNLRQLGKTDIELSAIGLGTWAHGGGGYRYGWGSQEDKDSIETIHRALDLGINWIDTAPIYGAGHAEEIVAQAIKGKREKVFLSTKCGMRMDDKKENIVYILKKESIRMEIEASLKRLNTDVIDMYQIHYPAPDEDIEEAWYVLASLVKEGKIRYAGVSNFNLAQLKRAQAIHPVAFLQPEYSMLARDIENGVLHYCQENKIGVIPYSPMYRGLLTGKITAERVANLPPDDNRLTVANYKEPFLSENLKFVDSLKPIADRNNHTLAQLAIAWIMRRPEISAVIVGARRPDQIEQTAPGGSWLLSEEDWNEVNALMNLHYKTLQSFTDAKKTAPAPKLIPPKNFRLKLENSTSPEYDTDCSLEINSVTTEGGMRFAFQFNNKEFNRTSVEQLAQIYQKNLGKIINHCLTEKKKIQATGMTATQYYIAKDYEDYLARIEDENLGNLSGRNLYSHVLLSGGTGFMGGHLVSELLTTTDAILYLPVRGKDQATAEDRFRKKISFYFGEDFYPKYKNRINVLCSDLSEIHLGLADSDYQKLCDCIDAVFHPAANVRHHGSYDELYRDNVVATERLLQLATDGKKKVDFHCVSTIDTGRGNIPGKDFFLFTEYHHDAGQRTNQIYLKSKFEAEKRVLTCRDNGLHCSIYRVGNLVFHTDTGRFQENISDDYFYAILRGAVKLEMITDKMNEIVFDMSYINYIARSMVLLALTKNLVNETFHLCNPNRLPMNELIGYLKKLGYHFNDVQQTQADNYLAKFEGNPDYEKIIERLKLHAWIFEEQEGTETHPKIDRTVTILKKLNLEWPTADIHLVEKMMAHCHAVGFL